MADTIPPDVHRTADDLRALVGQLKRTLRTASSANDLTSSQVAVLSRLHAQGPMSPSALAAAEHVRPQSMGATLLSLEERDLVRRRRHETDRRQVVITPTRAGERALHRGRSLRQAWLARAIASELTRAEQRQLAAAMPLLARIAAWEPDDER